MVLSYPVVPWYIITLKNVYLLPGWGDSMVECQPTNQDQLSVTLLSMSPFSSTWNDCRSLLTSLPSAFVLIDQ